MVQLKRTAFDYRSVAAMFFAVVLSACSGTNGSSSTSSTGIGTNAVPATTPSTQNTAASADPVSAIEALQGHHRRSPHDVLTFTASTFSAQQSAGSATITVERLGPVGTAVTVKYATADGTAFDGTDYTAVNGTLQWAENDGVAKSFVVPLNKSRPFEGNKTFEVVLSDPSAVAAIANPGSAAVKISGNEAVTLGTIELAAPTYAAGQAVGNLTVTVNRTNGSSGAVGVAYSTSNGTGIAGKDYSAASGTLNWVDGDTSPKTFTVAISNVVPFTGSKTFGIALSNPQAGATLGTPSNANVTISGDATLPVGSVHLIQSSSTVSQASGSATLSVARTGGTNGDLSVAFATTNGSAVAGTDFSGVVGTLQWANGDATTKSISVPILNAKPFAGAKTFTLALSKPSTGATIISPASASITINGDAVPPVGNLQLSASSYDVSQEAGTVTVTANRVAGTNGAISVTYSAEDGTAVAGTDYTAPTGTMNWTNGDSSAKTFSVPISNKSPFSGNRSFTVKLSNASGGATLSTPNTAIVTISGDAVAAVGALQLSAATNAVTQSAGSLTQTVNRTGGSSGEVTVAYGTSNGTAIAGSDYTASNGTLTWADGDATSKSFTVPISRATPFTGTKVFNIALSSVTGGAKLGAPNSESVTIDGSGAPPGSGGAPPSAPSGLVMTGQSQNQISLSWVAAAAGTAPISHYKIYRNGASYATSTTTSYTDSNANNANSPVGPGGIPTLPTANTVYSYSVSAVDTAGNEGPLQSNATFWVYYNGAFNWQGDFSYPAGQININYADTSGAPESGTADIEVNYSAAGSGFQPYAGKSTTSWDMEGGSFGYLSLDLKPTISSDSWRILMISRLPPGDVFPWSTVQLSNYGPTPVAGKWATYKIPLSVLTIGYTHFTGSISGTTLTVSGVSSGVGVDAGGYLTGPGVPAGTYITAYARSGGGAGTYTVAGPGISAATSVPSTSMVEQRTGIYKFNLVDESSAANNHYYVDNVRYTVN